MTLMVGSTQHRAAATAATTSSSSSGGGKHHGAHHSASGSRSHQSHRSQQQPTRPESGSDTSVSPVNDFSNTPTYRVPTKTSAGAGVSAGHHPKDAHQLMFRPDSSTESNNGDQSPVLERRAVAGAAGTPRHVVVGGGEQRSVSGGRRSAKLSAAAGAAVDAGRAISSNR